MQPPRVARQGGASRRQQVLLLLITLLAASAASFALGSWWTKGRELVSARGRLDVLEKKVGIPTTGLEQDAARDLALRDAEVRQLQERLQEKEAELLKSRDVTSSEKDADLTKKLSVVEARAERMKRLLRAESLASLRRKWGNGPIKVRLDTGEGEILIETAPFHLMPVTIDFWLSLVAEGYYTESSFFRNERHVVQATAESADQTQRKPARSGVIFQEFTAEFPHLVGTIGLAGRPGSTDFYVNMQDNRAAHGPGGQGEAYPGDQEADPCFAKVISGMEVVRRIQAMPYNREGGLHILKKRVPIHKAEIVSSSSS